jgi:cellulose synthase/poly-beta-1,6-N-acetylglucosamine synthase-like glycosyltransferase/peptidoglycan/xylan/chitin deacetylase (PgdA/CDA1 family)
MIFYDQKDKRKKYIRIFSVIFAVVVIGLVVSLTFNLFFALEKSSKTVENVDINKTYKYYFTSLNDKKISLTFDDGPNPTYTPAIVSILKKYNVPATFFFIGQNVFKYPDVAKEVSSAGFEIGNHTFTHSQKSHDSNERLDNELRTTNKMIEIATGKTSLFYRPPFLLNIGPDPTINPDISPEEPLFFAFQQGYIPVGADIDSKDWVVSSSKELLKNVLDEAPKGHIILLHDGGYADTVYMMDVLEEMIVTLKAEGYSFVSLRELLFPPSRINITNTLAIGSTDAGTNKEVTLLQWFLYSKNFLEYDFISGKFGNETENALQNWQLYNKVVHTDKIDNSEYGITGKKTREAILATSDKGKSYDTTMLAQVTLPNKINNILQRFNFMVVSSVFSVSKSLFWLMIILVISRVSVILGLYIFSYIKNLKKKKGKISYPYKGGVSILIPAYNEEENIESSILSVIRNNYSKKEIIVINDGSVDDTMKVVENMQLKYQGKIKLINIPNGGKANALNIGIKASNYEVFIVMDADTIFAPNTIENLVKHFNDKSIGSVAGKVETTKSGNILDIFQGIEYEVGQNIEKKVFASINAIGVVPGPVGAWRKSAVMKYGGYSRETLVEDQDLTLAIINAGYKILYEPEAFAYTETPHTLKDFLKQRFRWVYGTFQCVWKYKSYFIKKPFSPFSLVVLPNTVLFSLIVPLFYPIIDVVLVFSLIFGSWQQVLITYLIFTVVDVAYSSLAFVGRKENWRRLLFIPIQRLYYRQVIYYVVAKSILRAIEGSEEAWGKVAKNGESQKYYFTRFEKVVLETNATKSYN